MEAARVSFVPSDVTGVTNKKDAKTSHALTRAYSGSSTSSESRSLTLRPEETTYDNETGNGSGRNPYQFEGAAVVQEGAIAEGHGEVGHKELMHISKGLVTKERKNTDPAAAPVARGFGPGEVEGLGEGATLLEVVLKATRDSYSSQPAIFAMSNSEKNAEYTDAFKYAGENKFFASGNPFENVNLGNGEVGHVNQANNMYLLPRIGLGTLLSGARAISDGILQAASEWTNEEIKNGILYPSIQSIRHITTEVGEAVVQEAHGEVGPKELRHMSKYSAYYNRSRNSHFAIKKLW